MKAQQSLQEQELDHVVKVLALCVPPVAAEEAWEGQRDLSCPKSHVAQQSGGMAQLAWGHRESTGVLPKYGSSSATCAMKTSEHNPYFIYLATTNLLQDDYDYLKSAQATNTHLMDLGPPTKICYLWDTHISHYCLWFKWLLMNNRSSWLFPHHSAHLSNTVTVEIYLASDEPRSQEGYRCNRAARDWQ